MSMSSVQLSPEVKAELRGMALLLLALFVVPSVGAVVLAAAAPGSPWQDGVLWVLYMGAAAALASVLGLVFGVPRARAEFVAEATERYSSNSNLEEISDWLTKLLVGAGLVELTNIPGMIEGASDFLSEGMTIPYSRAFAAAALMYGAGFGFVAGYLWARLRFRSLLEETDRAAAFKSKLYNAVRAAKGPGTRESDRDVRNAVVDAIAVTSGEDTAPRRILWVDDWPGNNASLVEAMRSLQIPVDIALSTREALRWLERQSYGLIISDMGRLEDGEAHEAAGLELIKAVRDLDNRTPIFIYAGRSAVLRREELKTAGASLVTDKPSELFSEAVRTVTAPPG
jgi:CheY-like chemotaxis protein